MLGVYAGFLLASDLLMFRGKWARKLVLLMLGLLSFSLVFYLVAPVVLAGYLFRGGVQPTGRRALVVVLAAVSLALGISAFRAGVSVLVIPRMPSFGSRWEGDSGELSYGGAFRQYLASAGAWQIFVGNGPRVRGEKGAMTTYRGLVYELGLLGVATGLVFPLYWLVWRPVRRLEPGVALMTGACISAFYHRPEFLSSYVYILYGAVSCVLAERRGSAAPPGLVA